MRDSERSSAISSSTMARCIGEGWSPAFGYIVTLGGRDGAEGLERRQRLSGGRRVGRQGQRERTSARGADTALTARYTCRAVTTVTGQPDLRRASRLTRAHAETGAGRKLDPAVVDRRSDVWVVREQR